MRENQVGLIPTNQRDQFKASVERWLQAAITIPEAVVFNSHK